MGSKQKATAATTGAGTRGAASASRAHAVTAKKKPAKATAAKPPTAATPPKRPVRAIAAKPPATTASKTPASRATAAATPTPTASSSVMTRRAVPRPGPVSTAPALIRPPAHATTAAPRRGTAPARPALQPLVRPPVHAPAAPAPTRAPPPALAETAAALDIARLCRYGERFGAHRLEIQPVAAPLVITSGAIAVADAAPPGAAARKGALRLARPLPAGRYRCTLSIAHVDGAPRLAAAVLHVGRGPVARWVIAHADGKKPPRSADDAPGYVIESGTGAMLDAAALGRDTPPPDPAAPDVLTFAAGKPGAYVSYWGLDAEGYPACLVTDFAVFTKKDWKAKPVG